MVRHTLRRLAQANKEATALYERYLEGALSFASYNFKDYYTRQAQIKIRDAPEASLDASTKEYKQWAALRMQEIQQLERCATVNQMYQAPSLVIEGCVGLNWIPKIYLQALLTNHHRRGQAMAIGGGGAGKSLDTQLSNQQSLPFCSRHGSSSVSFIAI